MPSKSKTPFRNKSSTGWWIMNEVEQWVSQRQKKLSPKSRCLVWINTRLLRAKNRDEAYRKAIELGRSGHPLKSHGGEWRFVGISMLLPIYDEIEDGAEILWRERDMSVMQIKKLVKNKSQLSVFDDKNEK